MAEMLLQQLDFLYTPSRDVAANLVYFTDALGGRVVFAVEAMGPGSPPSSSPRIPTVAPGRPRRG